jgi:uncharacterized lipoprotein YmbA
MKATMKALLCAFVLSAACSSVVVPEERVFRLAAPTAAAPDPQRAGVLRVLDLQLGTAIDADALLRQDGVRLRPWPLCRWIAPLDRLVTDALILGLSRARVCELVKGAGDPGRETWTLHGRIVDFAEAAGAGGRVAKVGCELWLQQGEQVLLHDEFRAELPLSASTPDAAVDGLSVGLQQVTAGLIARMQAQSLFAGAKANGVGDVAAPAR